MSDKVWKFYDIIKVDFFNYENKIFTLMTILLVENDRVFDVYVMQLRSGEDPELRNTLKNASYRGGRAANCFNYSPTEGDGSVRAIRSSPG